MPLAEDFVAMECLIGCHNHQSSTSPTPWKWSMRWMRMVTLPGDIDSVNNKTVMLTSQREDCEKVQWPNYHFTTSLSHSVGR